MSKVKFEMNRAGVAELMKSSEMQSILKGHAEKIRNKAGIGYDSDLHVGKNRANAMVWADSSEARRDNSKNNTLLKSVK